MDPFADDKPTIESKVGDLAMQLMANIRQGFPEGADIDLHTGVLVVSAGVRTSADKYTGGVFVGAKDLQAYEIRGLLYSGIHVVDMMSLRTGYGPSDEIPPD